MEMRVVQERLSPGVEHGKEADLGAEVARIRGDGTQRLGRRAEEDAVDHRFVLQGDLGDRLWDGEDDVKVLGLEEVGLAGLDPRRAGEVRS